MYSYITPAPRAQGSRAGKLLDTGLNAAAYAAGAALATFAATWFLRRTFQQEEEREQAVFKGLLESQGAGRHVHLHLPTGAVAEEWRPVVREAVIAEQTLNGAAGSAARRQGRPAPYEHPALDYTYPRVAGHLRTEV